MHCPTCQRPAPADAVFCPACGTPLTRVCPGCGAANAAADNFCRRCGQPLAAAAPAAATVLASRGAREGERKQVTVLFADIKGSMELLTGRDPEDARQLLDPVLQAMIDAVHRYEGTVNQVMGDGIMALFGAPVAHEDHALRACYAALRIHELLRHIGDVQARVGLNSGEVVVRAIGSDVNVDYTAVGETTHLAARLEQRAEPGSILLAQDTLRLIDGFVDVRPLGPQQVKGRAEPVEVFELKAVRPVRSRLHVSAAQGLAPFVGRADELADLERARARAAEGRGQVVAVVGEAGVGKSRFVWEFVRACEAEGWRVLETGCISYGQRAPYAPVAELLRGWSGIQDHDDVATARRKVREAADELDVTPLLAVLGLPPDDAAWTALEPLRRRDRTIDAVKRLLLRASQREPVVLVVEDLHWVDTETQRVLDGLVDALGAARLLLVVNHRPEYRHEWSGKTSYRHIRLDPLGARSGETLLDALLGADPSLRALKRQLLDRTEGNPFFLEETVRALVETGVLDGVAGAYTVVRSSQTIEIPPTVQAVLAARIDRLTPDDKRVLQCAAVVGKDVPLTLLEAIVDVPPAAVRASLGRLQAAELLYEAQLFPDIVYTFKHALTHEVAYSGLLGAQRRALHARIARAIETLHAGRLAEHAERLSYHAFRGEEWPLAFTSARQAAARSAALCVDPDAERLYERALDALAHLPAGRERDTDDIDLRLDMRAVLWRLGRVDRMTQLFADAEVVAARLGDARRLNAIYAFLLQYHWAMGEHPRGLVYGERCLAAASALDDRALAVIGHLYLGHIHYTVGDLGVAVDALRRNVELLDAEPTLVQPGISGLPYAMSCAWAALALADAGAFAEARVLAALGEAAATRAEHAYSLAAVQVARGNEAAVRGDAATAIAILEPAIATCREKHFAGWVMLAAWSLTRAYLDAGRAADALTVCREGRTLKDASGARVWRGHEQALMAEALLANGRVDEARAVAADALQAGRAQGERGSEGEALYAVGGIAAADLPPAVDDADAALTDALAVLEPCGFRPLVARAYLRLGEIRAAHGRSDGAREAVASAREMFQALGMIAHARRAEETLARMGGS